MPLELETDQLFPELEETVTFRGDLNEPVEVAALVSIDTPLRDTSGYSPTIYTGILIIKTEDRERIMSQPNELLTVEQGEYSWRVVDVGDDNAGLFSVGIQRENHEHSNAVDLSGNQHRYG